MDKNIVIFEEILPVHRWIVKWYTMKYGVVYYLRINLSCRKYGWVERYINDNRLKQINIDYKNKMFRGKYHDLAYDNVEIFYKAISDDGVIARFKELYDDRVEHVFKKAMNEETAGFYYLNYILYKIQNAYPDNGIIFIPSHGIEGYRSDGCEIYDYALFYKWAGIFKAERHGTDNTKFPAWATAISYCYAAGRKFKIFIIAVGFLFWACALAVKRRINVKSYYKYAIVIISSFRQFANRIQGADFLVDGDSISKEEVIFLSANALSKENKKYLTDNNYDFMDDPDAFVSIKDIVKVFPIYTYLLALSLFGRSFILETGLKALLFYLRWEGFSRKCNISNLITFCDFGIQSICRNIILKNHGTKTWYYMDATNYGLLFVPIGDDFKRRHTNFGFLNYDYLISWNEISSEYFKSSHTNVGAYFNVGCLWSQHIKEIAEGEMRSSLKETLLARGYNSRMKLVSVFDSTFHDDSITTYEDGIIFLKDILKLLEDKPDIFVILKEKNIRNYHLSITDKHAEILQIYTKLEEHPRCCSITRWESSSEVIVFSDLTISFPFTSTSLEALSARKKAIWYDASNKFRNTYYDSVPGLVCHDYGELVRRVEELLYKTSDEAYNDYLNRYIKGRLEDYLDGKAISRFRKLLTDNADLTNLRKTEEVKCE